MNCMVIGFICADLFIVLEIGYKPYGSKSLFNECNETLNRL